MIDGEIIVADTERNTPRLRGAAAAHPPGREPGQAAVRADPGQLRRVRPARPRRRRPDRAAASPSAGPLLERGARRRAAAGPRHPGHPRPRRRRGAGSTEFEGAGLDGLIAKKLDLPYQPDKRVMTQDQARADRRLRGRRLPGAQVRRRRDRLAAARPVRRPRRAGLGRRDRRVPDGRRRKELFDELQPLVTTFDGHPWNWAAHEEGERTPRKNETSRWNAGKDLSFVPLRPERVVEVRYDYMEGVRFRHTAQFVRWRPDREPAVLHLRAARTARALRPRRRPDQRLITAELGKIKFS